MVIRVASLVTSCDSNDEGDIIRRVILRHLDDQQHIELDFSGIPNVTSSFVNSAFVELLPHHDFEAIKNRVKIRRVNRQIGNMIKTRLATEAQTAHQ